MGLISKMINKKKKSMKGFCGIKHMSKIIRFQKTKNLPDKIYFIYFNFDFKQTQFKQNIQK